MDVDQGKGKSRGKKGHSSKGKGKHRGKSKGKSMERSPRPCLLCQGPHWARNCTSHHGGKGQAHAYLEGNERDWITGAGVIAEFRKISTSKGSSSSTLEPRCPWEVLIFYRELENFTQMLGIS